MLNKKKERLLKKDLKKIMKNLSKEIIMKTREFHLVVKT